MLNVLMMFVFRSKSPLSFLEQLFLVMELQFTLNFYALLGMVLEECDGDRCQLFSTIACLSPFSSQQACLRWGRMACFLHLQLMGSHSLMGEEQLIIKPIAPQLIRSSLCVCILFLWNRMNKELFEGKCCSLLNFVHYFVQQLDAFHYAHRV